MDAVSEKKKKAIAAYMREHPEVTSKSAIAKAAGTNRNMVRKYCNEIRSELGLKYAQELRRSKQHKFPLELAPEGIWSE